LDVGGDLKGKVGVGDGLKGKVGVGVGLKGKVGVGVGLKEGGRGGKEGVSRSVNLVGAVGARLSGLVELICSE
jgi:hypothetical protein